MKISSTVQISAFALIPLLTTAKRAQDSKWYVRACAGYAFPLMSPTSFAGGTAISGSNEVSISSPVSGWQQTQFMSVKRASFGTGASLCLAGGYKLSQHITVSERISIWTDLQPHSEMPIPIGWN